MRKSKLPLKKLYAFVSHFLKRVGPNRQAKKKGRPQKYEDALIITLWLFQILNNYSYRETLEKAKDEGFNVPSLCDYHYRVRQLDDELLKSILEECAKLLLEDKQILCYIADATGFGFGDKSPTPATPNLNWKRETQIKNVQSHVEQMFGSIKQNIGSSFKLLREDLARKASIACAILWNFWVLVTSLFLLFLSGVLHYSYAKGYGRFLEQSILPQLTSCFFLYDNNSMQLDDKAIAKRVKEMVLPIVSKMGYKLFDVEFKPERGWVLRIIVDKEGGITVGDCEEVSKRISALLDVEDIIPFSYMLEVSSPGLTRELTKAEHFSFFKGRLVRVVLREPIQNRRELIGEIEDVKEDVLVLRDKRTEELLHIPLSVIARANLEIEKW